MNTIESSEAPMNQPPARAIILLIIWLLGLAWLHWLMGHGFPAPWNDEVHFLIPADSFARTGTLTAPQMLNPTGIFWMPPTMYLVDGMAFRLSGAHTLDAARWVSFAELCAATYAVWFAVRRLLQPPALSAWYGALAVAALWSFATPVQLSGNIARPDSLSMLLSLSALVAFLNGRYALVLSLSAINLTTHPLQAAPTLVLSAAALLHWRGAGIRGFEWAAVLVSAALAGVAIQQFVQHPEMYLEHFRYQLLRKGSRGIDVKILACALALVLTYLAYATRQVRARFAATPDPVSVALAAVLYGLAMLFVYAYGREMAYSYALYTGALFIMAGVLALLVSWRPGFFQPAQQGAALIAVTILVHGLGSWGWALKAGSWAGMPVISPTDMFAVRADQQAIAADPRLASIAASTDALVDPFLYPLLVPEFGPGRSWTYNPLSEASPRVEFRHYLHIERNYPQTANARAAPDVVLFGYKCTSLERVHSPHGLYQVAIRSLIRTQAPQAFVDCPGQG